jgi:hypothetical protein
MANAGLRKTKLEVGKFMMSGITRVEKPKTRCTTQSKRVPRWSRILVPSGHCVARHDFGNNLN